MAIVTQPLGSSEARGSVGGYTYSTWRGKHTVRTRAGPSREPTADQLAVIAKLTTYAQQWANLTDAQRLTWRLWAADHRLPHWTGQDKRLSGQMWFIKCNVILDLAGGGTSASAPTADISDYFSDLVVYVFGADIVIEWQDPQAHDFSTCWVNLWLAGPHSTGRNPTLHDADMKESVDITSANTYWFGLANGDYTLFYRLINHHGLTTPFQSARFTIDT